MKVRASAKLNLCLDILKKTPSGYHEIQTVFHELTSLQDELEIYETQEPDNVSIFQYPEKSTYPQQKILAFQAIKLLKETYKIDKNVTVKIQKNIPLSSGLGGSSSNAACVLKALNELWELDLVQSELIALAGKLGADVPFFILGGTALGTHFGEELTPLTQITNLEFELQALQSPSENKTVEMYAKLDLSKCGQNTDKTEKLLAAIKANDSENILANLHNDFETLNPPPKNSHLTGSGPTTFKAKILRAQP